MLAQPRGLLSTVTPSVSGWTPLGLPSREGGDRWRERPGDASRVSRPPGHGSPGTGGASAGGRRGLPGGIADTTGPGPAVGSGVDLRPKQAWSPHG